jgi:hypothetical protein
MYRHQEGNHQCLEWVNFGLSRPTAATSAFKGKAVIPRPLSAHEDSVTPLRDSLTRFFAFRPIWGSRDACRASVGF